MKWLEVAITSSPEYEEYVVGILYALDVNGLTIEDPKDILDLAEKTTRKDWDFIDEKLLNFKENDIIIRAYFSEDEDTEYIKNYILEEIEKKPYMQVGKKYGEVSFQEVEDRDWSEVWKQGYKPIEIGENLVIKPSWEDYDKKDKDIIIELDPGMAFGTGDHETTFMCAEALESYMDKDSLVYDIGAGSGILSIIAAKLGAKKVVGVDLDPVSIEVAKDNIDINNVGDRVDIIRGNLFDVIDDEYKADAVVANIIAEVIVDLVPILENYLKIGGIFISSGIIKDKAEIILNALDKYNYRILEVNNMGEWVSIVAQR